MSSSSSSGCMCSDCLQYGANFQNNKPRKLFCQNLGDPLIYYAQVHPRTCNRSKDLRKTSPNCFVKAFRWYTQEHLPQTKSPRRQNDITEFAVWLDHKYDEFLQNRQIDDCCGIRQRKMSDFNKENVKTSVLYKSHRKKIFARAKSPWKNRQTNIKSKECDCTLDKCSHSLEYIMKPKDLSRAASDCCNNRRSASNRSRSKVSISSFEMHASMKTLVTNLDSDKNGYNNVNPTDIGLIKTDGSLIRTPSCNNKSNIKSNQHIAPNPSNVVVLTRNTYSQYPEKTLVTRDVATQYYETDIAACSLSEAAATSLTKKASGVQRAFELNERKNEPGSRRLVGKRSMETETDLCECPQLLTKLNIQNQPEKYDACCCCNMDYKPKNKDQKTTAYEANEQTCCVNCSVQKIQDQCQKSEQKLNTYEKPKKLIINKSTNNYVQTSDRAINLENSGVCKYPFCMKIVCADKLKDEAQK